MKPFLYTILFLTCIVFNAENIVAKETKQNKETNQSIVIIDSASEHQYILTSASDLFNHTACRETWQYSFQRLLPTFHKYSIIGDLSETETGLPRKSKINSYVAYAENHIIRLEVTDIIHPYDYFW